MSRNEFAETVSSSLKLVRTEYDYSQEKMAEILGLSKKTLVEIEKGRKLLNWTASVTLATLFDDSEILRMHLGEDIGSLIKAIAFTNYDYNKKKTLGGKIWWKEIINENGYRVQQNLISQHYRILDSNDYLICSSFDLDFIKGKYNELTNNNKRSKENV